MLFQIEREKLEGDEVNSRLREDRERLDRSTASYEQENQELQRQLHMVNQQLADTEQEHARKLVDITSRHRQEMEMESDRSRQSQTQIEKTQVARERAHKQRIKGLEEQVMVVHKTRHVYIPLSLHTICSFSSQSNDRCLKVYKGKHGKLYFSIHFEERVNL